MSITNSDVINFLNYIISEVNGKELPGPCPSGTTSDINVSCDKEMSFSGTYGNTTTAGYYASYNATVDNISNIFDFVFTDITGNDFLVDTVAKTYQSSFTCKYTSAIKATGTASAKTEVYIPQYQTSGICTSCNRCGLHCGCGLTTKSCVTYWNSTYNSSLLLPASDSYTCYINDGVMTGNVSFTCSPLPPPTLPSGVSIKTINTPGTYTPFYIWEVQITDLTLTYQSFNVSNDIDNTVNESTVFAPGEVQTIIGLIFPQFQNIISQTLNKQIWFFSPPQTEQEQEQTQEQEQQYEKEQEQEQS